MVVVGFWFFDYGGCGDFGSGRTEGAAGGERGGEGGSKEGFGEYMLVIWGVCVYWYLVIW